MMAMVMILTMKRKFSVKKCNATLFHNYCQEIQRRGKINRNLLPYMCCKKPHCILNITIESTIRIALTQMKLRSISFVISYHLYFSRELNLGVI